MTLTRTFYRFLIAYPGTGGLGSAQEVRLRSTDTLLGYVRKILEPSEPGSAWMVYDAEGAEWGVSDQRGTAARALHRQYVKDVS